VWFENLVNWFAEAENALSFAQLVAAFVTALATFALWRVTRVLAVETKTLAAMTSRPFVVCGIESSLADAQALNLVLRNTGNATAFDVIAKITPPLPKQNGRSAEDATETMLDVSFLPPSLVLPRKGFMSREIQETTFNVEVSWSLMPGATKRETLSYTMEPQDGFRGGWTEKGLHQIAQELEKVRKIQERK
jgi:hypothetical protein